MAGNARQAGTHDETSALVGAVYHLTKGVAACERALADAGPSGDPAHRQLFQDWREEQQHLLERAKNLLAARLGARPEDARRARGGAAKKAGARGASVRTQVSEGVKSGGNAWDDIVDLQSKESFPASDSPATY
ncbi:hypothetical protein DRW03_23420 [Corallococcus sp. H22C18031201]|uniref:hypothetical protein n=1 Tax=Citreicoccus inhibens TaxID=2849499 RepID=UPI000E76DD20|nr:hypothetical protein [Citreicoccus inhibens]MBU8897626.1 hypothetical protein [Citreicoccus inhibens]RJS19303.1 hypothetical protein DRW03_23420 [Corallococcus sp. H22C18031201]